MSDRKLVCVWNQEECSEEVREVEFFNPQILVPVCTAHIEQHKMAMAVHHHGIDVEEILALPKSQWKDFLKNHNIDWEKTDE